MDGATVDTYETDYGFRYFAFDKNNGFTLNGQKMKLQGVCMPVSYTHLHVYIQTPYFIPDDSILDALKIAAKSGVDVRIMIPCKPDHPFVYWAKMCIRDRYKRDCNDTLIFLPVRRMLCYVHPNWDISSALSILRSSARSADIWTAKDLWKWRLRCLLQMPGELRQDRLRHISML